MLNSLLTLWGSFKTWIALAGVAVIALVSIYFTGRSHGASSVTQELNEGLLQDVKDQKELQDETSRLTHDDLRERMRKWTRG